MKQVTRWLTGMLLICALSVSLNPVANAQNRDNFYRGARSRPVYNNRYDRGHHYDRRDQGGIGPGKGALIGAAGGAVLGTVFGGGLKGALIGGAAGAGVGAVAGKIHQDNRDRDYRDRYDRYGRRY
jgi:hypothetical protein